MWIKERSPSGAFDFFTYAELICKSSLILNKLIEHLTDRNVTDWFVFCVAINPFRWKW